MTCSALRAERCDAGMHTHILFLKCFSIIDYYEALNKVPCTVQSTFLVCFIPVF